MLDPASSEETVAFSGYIFRVLMLLEEPMMFLYIFLEKSQVSAELWRDVMCLKILLLHNCLFFFFFSSFSLFSHKTNALQCSPPLHSECAEMAARSCMLSGFDWLRISLSKLQDGFFDCLPCKLILRQVC